MFSGNVANESEQESDILHDNSDQDETGEITWFKEDPSGYISVVHKGGDDNENLEHEQSRDFVKEIDTLQGPCGNFKVGEVFSTSHAITAEAQNWGLDIMEPITLNTGWDLLDEAKRQLALERLKAEKPDFLVIAFPCSAWSTLSNFGNGAFTVAQRREGQRALVEFSAECARFQMEAGRYFVIENAN